MAWQGMAKPVITEGRSAAAAHRPYSVSSAVRGRAATVSRPNTVTGFERRLRALASGAGLERDSRRDSRRDSSLPPRAGSVPRYASLLHRQARHTRRPTFGGVLAEIWASSLPTQMEAAAAQGPLGPLELDRPSSEWADKRIARDAASEAVGGWQPVSGMHISERWASQSEQHLAPKLGAIGAAAEPVPISCM